MGSDFFSKIIPKTFDGLIMWVISFAMLFLLFRKHDRATKTGEKFWSRENFEENPGKFCLHGQCRDSIWPGNGS